MTDLATVVESIRDLDNAAKDGGFDAARQCLSAALDIPPACRSKLLRHVAWTHHVTLVVQTLIPTWSLQLTQYRHLLESTMVSTDEDEASQCTMALVGLRALLEGLHKDVSLDTLEIYSILLKRLVSPKLLKTYLTMEGDVQVFCSLVCSIPSRLANAFGLQSTESNTWYLDRSMYPIAVSQIRSGNGSHWPDVWAFAQAEKVWQAMLLFVRESVTENTIDSAGSDLAKILGQSTHDFLTHAIFSLSKLRQADSLVLRLAIAAAVHAAGLEGLSSSESGPKDNVKQLTPAARDLLKGFIDRVVAKWTDTIFIKHAGRHERLYISSALLILIGYLGKEEAQDLFYTSALPSGAHRWLQDGDMESAKLGMTVAKSISTLIDSEDVQLNISILDPKNDQQLFELMELIFVKDALKQGKNESGESCQIVPVVVETPSDSEVEEEEELDPDALVIPDQEEDEDSDLEPYPMDEESDEDEPRSKRKPKHPVYIRDLIQFLRDVQDPVKLEIGLDAAEGLVRQKTGVGAELRESAVDLANALMRMPNDYDIPGCEEKVQHALAALMVAEPEKTASRAIDTLYHRSTSINTQQIILTALHLAARELAGWLTDQTQSIEDELEIEPSKQLVGKVRVFSRSMEVRKKQAKGIKTNRLSGLAGPVFFFPLLVGWWEGAQARMRSWIGNSKVLTEQLIRTLNMIMYCATNTPEKRRIVTEYFEFALALRYADGSPGMTRALLLGITVILNTSYKDQEWLLWNDYARQLEETKFWVQDIVDSNKEEEIVKQAALGITELISCPATVEHLLESLTSDQILTIEETIHNVKKRKLSKKKKNMAEAASTIASALAAVIFSSNATESISFTYSHHRTLQRYSIRTDLHSAPPESMGKAFKDENCIYPRANVPQEAYKGNRWAYETECNVLGWQLAWLNPEIAGRRGLIQRAVDSYRNHHPTMRSRRVARQEKLKNGTLRKRSGTKEFLMLDGRRIKTNVQDIELQDIPPLFRQSNSVFPKALAKDAGSDKTTCNELGWKLAWLNQKHLSNKRILLQRALDLYRATYLPSLPPRQRMQPLSPTISFTSDATESVCSSFLSSEAKSSPSPDTPVVSLATDLTFDWPLPKYSPLDLPSTAAAQMDLKFLDPLATPQPPSEDDPSWIALNPCPSLFGPLF
ncbi:telomere binding protein [Apophysomyces sp. BC1021]|nr:telomere binding protein [Apophysomyces sp. BC1021]